MLERPTQLRFRRELPPALLSCMVLLLIAQSTIARADAAQYAPVKWERFVKVDGQPLPVLEQWLQDKEARIEHSLKLPGSVPKPQPIDFTAAWPKSWIPGSDAGGTRCNHLSSGDGDDETFGHALLVRRQQCLAACERFVRSTA